MAKSLPVMAAGKRAKRDGPPSTDAHPVACCRAGSVMVNVPVPHTGPRRGMLRRERGRVLAMAHIRKRLAAAVALNTAVFAAEAAAGAHAHSLSLVMDAVPNFSDELALLCLLAAYVFAVSLSNGLQRIGNLLNSLGLITVSAVIVWQAIDRFLHPVPVIGWLPLRAPLPVASAPT